MSIPALFIALLGSADFHLSLLIYWTMVAAYHSRETTRLLTRHRVRTSQLAAQLYHARVRALEMQLRPHFLFNALNGVATLLLRTEFVGAGRMLDRLQGLLRLTFRSFDRQQGPLADEMAWRKRDRPAPAHRLTPDR